MITKTESRLDRTKERITSIKNRGKAWRRRRSTK